MNIACISWVSFWGYQYYNTLLHIERRAFSEFTPKEQKSGPHRANKTQGGSACSGMKHWWVARFRIVH